MALHISNWKLAFLIFQSAYVFLVTLVAPIVAVIMLLFLNKPKILLGGAWLLLVSMLASLLFSIVYHLVVPSSDNIFTVMQNPSLSSLVFTSTAILLLIVEGVGTWIGVRASRTKLQFYPCEDIQPVPQSPRRNIEFIRVQYYCHVNE